MTRPSSLSAELPELTHRLGSVFPSPPSLSSNVVDRAAGIDVVIPGGGGDIALVQKKEGGSGLGAQATITLDDTATAGDLLTASFATRGSDDDPTTPDGWTIHPDGTVDTGTGSLVVMYYKTSDGTETGITFSPAGGGGWVGGISEWPSGLTLDDSAETSGTTAPPDLSGAEVTPTAGEQALIVGAMAIAAGDAAETGTPDAGWTELHDAKVPTDLNPHLYVAYRVEASASGSYTPSASVTESNPAAFAAQTLVFTQSGNPISGGPNATDGDDSTCIEGLSGTIVADIDLGDRYQIVRSTVRLAIAAGGSRTYTISGYNVADGSDIETLDSVTFTADGSFIAQTINFSWNNGASYRYFRLTGPDETRNLCTWELYEGTFADFHDHDYIPEATFDQLGDLLVGTGSDTYARKGSVSSNVYSLQTRQDGDIEWQPFVRSIVSNGSNTLQRPDIAVQAGTGIALGVSSNTLTITNIVPASGSSGSSGGGSVELSYGSNANDVAGVSAAGASTLVSRADHVHRGVSAIAHSSNTFRGTVTLTTPGDTVGITSPTPGTFALTASGGSSGGGGTPAASLTPWVVPVEVFVSSSNTNWNSFTAGHMHSNGTQNDELIFEGVTLDAGTWMIEGRFFRSSNHGIITFSLDGASVGTIDEFGGVLDNWYATATGIVIATGDTFQLSLKMATKNASSGGYYGLVKYLQFRRTA